MERGKATSRHVRVRTTVFSLSSSCGVRFRFHASADGATWREIDSFSDGAIGVHERRYPMPAEPYLRILSEPIGAGGTVVVRTEILGGPELDGPRVERRR